MKILLDPQIFNDQKFGGISKYYSEIYKELIKKNVAVSLPLLFTENLHIKGFFKSDTSSIYNFFIRNNIFKRKFIRKIKRQNLAHATECIKNAKFDLFIPTYYNPYFLEIIKDKPFVLTVYDMIHELFPQYFSPSDKTSQNKKQLIEKSAKIIAVSNNTKKDLLKFFPDINPDKIAVVYHGFSSEDTNPVLVHLPKRYILFVGNRENYKNFNFLLDSVHKLLKKDSGLYLVCAGGNSFKSDERKLISSYNIADKVQQYNFLDSELNSYYKQALCFVFPSIYEGFGIPIMESMINQCPIILTNNSCFPEVAADAALYYELGNKNDLLEKVETFVYNEEMRKKYIDLGLDRVKTFTWKKAAKQCLEVYKSAVAQA